MLVNSGVLAEHTALPFSRVFFVLGTSDIIANALVYVHRLPGFRHIVTRHFGRAIEEERPVLVLASLSHNESSSRMLDTARDVLPASADCDTML